MLPPLAPSQAALIIIGCFMNESSVIVGQGPSNENLLHVNAMTHHGHILEPHDPSKALVQGLKGRTSWAEILIDREFEPLGHRATRSRVNNKYCETDDPCKMLFTCIFPFAEPEYMYCAPVVSIGLKWQRISVRKTA
jgi:hypothetical protein